MMTKFKSTLILSLIAFTLLLGGVFLSACQKTSVIESLEFKSGSVKTTFNQNAQVDISGMKALAKYSDGKTKEILRSDLEIGEIDTTTIGPKTASVAYSGKSFDFAYTVVGQDVNPDAKIISYEAPKFIADFNSNRGTNTGDFAGTAESTFINSQEVYYVGSDNAFIFKPVVTVYKPNDSNSASITIILTEYTSDIKIEVQENNTWVEKTGTDRDALVTFNARTGVFNFKASAHNKTFRVTQTPTYEYNMSAVIEARSVSHTFKVISGWNAVTARDLSMIDNRHIQEYWEDGESNGEAEGDVWKNIRPSTVDVKAVIMHNNISITKNDIPSDFITSEGFLVGEESNIYEGIYKHKNAAGDGFQLVGNYFTINASSIPYMKIFTDEEDEEDSDTPTLNPNIQNGLIVFEGKSGESSETANAHFEIKNVRVIGNAQRRSASDITGLGGLDFVCVRTDFASITVSNIIAQTWKEFADLSDAGERIIKDSRIYDCYVSVISLHISGEENHIINSEIKRAGGPLVIVNGDEEFTDIYLCDYINTDNKSIFEN